MPWKQYRIEVTRTIISVNETVVATSAADAKRRAIEYYGDDLPHSGYIDSDTFKVTKVTKIKPLSEGR